MVSRIDASRRGVRGVSAPVTTPNNAPAGDFGLGQLAQGAQAVHEFKEKRKAVLRAEEEQRRKQADTLHLARVKGELNRQWGEAALEAQAGYDGAQPGFAESFEAQLNAQMKDQLTAMPARLQPDAELAFTQIRDRFALGAIEIEANKREAFALNGVERAVNANMNAIRTDSSAFSGALEDLDAIVAAAPEGVQRQLREEAQADYAQAYIEAREEEDPHGLKAEFESGALDHLLDPRVKSAGVSSVNREIKRRRAEQEAARKEAEREAKAAQREAAARARASIADVKSAVSNGLPPKREDLARAIEEAERAGDADLIDDISEQLDLIDYTADLAGLSLPELEAERNRVQASAQAGGAGETEVARIDMANAALSAAQRASENGTQLDYVRERAYVNIAPFNFDEDLGPQLRNRVAMADAAGEHVPGARPKVFLPGEAPGLKQRMEAASPEEQMQFFAVIAHAAGDDATRIFGELADDAPVLAHMGALATISPSHGQIARRAVEGRKMIAEGTELLPSNADLEDAAAGVLDMPGLSGEARRAVIDTAKGLYVRNFAQSGKTADDFSEEAFKAHVQEALGRNGPLGGRTTFNGSPVAAPPLADRGAFTRALSRLTDADLERVSATGGAPVYGASGERVEAADIRDGYLVQAGAGRYRVSLTNPSRSMPEYVIDGTDGGYWEIDMRDPSLVEGLARNPIPVGDLPVMYRLGAMSRNAIADLLNGDDADPAAGEP